MLQFGIIGSKCWWTSNDGRENSNTFYPRNHASGHRFSCLLQSHTRTFPSVLGRFNPNQVHGTWSNKSYILGSPPLFLRQGSFRVHHLNQLGWGVLFFHWSLSTISHTAFSFRTLRLRSQTKTLFIFIFVFFILSSHALRPYTNGLKKKTNDNL